MKTELEYLLPFRRYSTRKTTIWRDISLFLLLAVRIHSYGCWVYNVVQVSIRNSWCWRLYISETITTTETRFAPFGSVTLALSHCENGTRISLNVSEIFDRKNSPERDISLFLLLLFFFYLSARTLATYLLLQEWSDPGNFDIISNLGIGRREFLILAGKFQLVDSLWGETFTHYKHRRRSTTYLLREIPVKNRECWGRGVNTRENCRVNTKCNSHLIVNNMILQGTISPSLRLSLSLSLSVSLWLSFSLSPSLSLFSHYKYRPHSINYTCQCEDLQYS